MKKKNLWILILCSIAITAMENNNVPPSSLSEVVTNSTAEVVGEIKDEGDIDSKLLLLIAVKAYEEFCQDSHCTIL